MNLFGQLAKYDEKTGYFEAIAANETPDRSGEIFDYERSKPHFKAWSAEIAKATDGKSAGNLRVMHGKAVAGKLTTVECNDESKAVKVAGFVIDENEKKKFGAGCYTGVSIGGRYAEKWDDPTMKGMTRYEAVPVEISIVDLPCNPDAQFTVVKSDGSEELRKFEATQDSVVEVRVTFDDVLQKLIDKDPDAVDHVMAKIAERKGVNPKEGEKKYGDVEFADEKNKKYALGDTKQIKAAWSYINMPKNAAKYDAADVKTMKGKIVAAWKAKIDKAGPPSAEKLFNVESLAKRADVQAVAKAAAALIGYTGELEKGLYAVSRLAEILDCLYCMADGQDFEDEAEGDGSENGDKMRAAIKPLAECLVAMAAEEANEAAHGQLNDDASLELAANGDLAKAGRKHTKAMREHRDAIREHAKGINQHLDAMAEDDPANQDDDDGAEKLAKAADDLQKITVERDALRGQLAEVTKQLAVLAQQPAKPKGVARAVEKAIGIEAPPNPDDKPITKADGSIDHAAEAQRLMKAAYRKPISQGLR